MTGRLLLAGAAGLLVLVTGCTQEDDVPDPIPAADARERVPVLLEQGVDAFALSDPPVRLDSDVGESSCDDTTLPDGASLVRVTGGRQLPLPAENSVQLVESVSATLAEQNDWGREKAPTGETWRLFTPDGYAVVLASVSPDLVAVQVSAPCAQP